MSLCLVTGGIRSGKSEFAEQLAEKMGGSVLYVATGVAVDEEMKERIARHQLRRPTEWGLLEKSHSLNGDMSVYLGFDLILLDSLSAWLANRLMDTAEEKWGNVLVTQEILKELEQWLDRLTRADKQMIVVTDETGWGGVALSPLGRWFQDVLGNANQMVAGRADQVFVVVSGIPWCIKGRENDES